MDFRSTCEFGFGGEGTGKLTEHLVIRATQSLHTGIVGAFDDAFQMIDGSLTICSNRTDRVVRFVRKHGDSGALKAVVFEHLTDAFEMRWIADIKNRNLDAVVTGLLEFFDDGVVRLGDVTGIKQEIEADFHGWTAKLGKGGRIGKVCVVRFGGGCENAIRRALFRQRVQTTTQGQAGKIDIEKKARDFISVVVSFHAGSQAGTTLRIMTALRFAALSALCFALASCENTKSSGGGNDPYASNYGNDGHYNPYPGQTGYAQKTTPSYQTPPTPVQPEPPADPYAFGTPKKTTPSTSSSAPKKTIASSGSAKKSKTSKSTSKKSSGTRYSVAKGDTLYGIALKKKTTVAKLKAANGLSGDLIRPGQSLKIP